MAPADASLRTAAVTTTGGTAAPDVKLMAKQLNLSSGEELRLRSVIKDPDGTQFVRYDRTFKGLPVIGGDLIVRRNEAGKIQKVTYNASGKAAVASTAPRLSAATAQAKLRAKESRLVVFAAKGEPVLAHEVVNRGVKADQTPFEVHSYIDATSGKVLASQDRIKSGTGNTQYSGTVGIGTSRPGTDFHMSDPSRGGNHTTDLNGATSGTGTLFTDPDDTWGDGTTASHQTAGADAHYGAQVTWDYYKNIYGRNGIWNDGRGARSRVHYGNGYVNAFWDGTQMTYGDGRNNQWPLTSLDVAGHEMTHGVTEATANLNYFGESGGLNEATSDIFGTATEFYSGSSRDPGDYLIGEKININGNGTPLRRMDRPSWDGLSRDCWSSDLGNLDPHYSSGPLNHWFYLASEGTGTKVIGGETHSSTSCDGSTVTPVVGKAVAERVWYRTLTTKLTSSSNYIDARNGAVASARELFGAGSRACNGIIAAFNAISVYGTERCTNWAAWAETPNAKTVAGDVNADGREDLILTGGVTWTSVPVAFSGGNGTFTIANQAIAGDWPRWAEDPNVKAVSGDFNADKKADIALTGGPGWASQPVAFSNGNGTFTVTNAGIPGDWPRWAEHPDVRTVAGDFNGDLRTDLALIGGPGWTTQPVAFSNGDGTFTVSNQAIPGDWGRWAEDPNVKKVAGDFNNDGKADLALAGGPGWASQPVAFGKGDGTFTISNLPLAGDWPGWANHPSVEMVSGDFNNDKKWDLALTAGPGWTTQPVAFSNGNGTFTVSNQGIYPDWGRWAEHPKVSTTRGDFNGDLKADLALTGGPGWETQPVAFSNGNGTFDVTNHFIG